MNLPKNLLTIYGRKPVLEVLKDTNIEVFRLHLATSNQASATMREITQTAEQRGIEIQYHDRMALSRISKNKKQDQGVAADIIGKRFQEFNEFIANPPRRDFSLLGVDRVTNPQNLGMIIRSVCAGTSDGLIIPRRGCAKIDSLVIKASAGTVFKARLLFCDTLEEAAALARQRDVAIYGMCLENARDWRSVKLQRPSIYLLGNETEGLSPQLTDLCTDRLFIPMRNGVESLNVSATATLISFMD